MYSDFAFLQSRRATETKRLFQNKEMLMKGRIQSNRVLIAGALALAAAWGPAAGAATKDLENGFADHGVTAPVSIVLGASAAVGDRGQDLLLGQLKDCRGTYGMLVLDFATGECSTTMLETPYDSFRGVFAALYSPRGNRFYCHHSSVMTEFDPVSKTYTFIGRTHEGMGMAMTEDDRGVIWTVTYPDCGLVSFDPKSRELRDYGGMVQEEWPHYARTIAADDAGWVYFGYGMTKGQLFGFHPQTGAKVRLFDDAKRPDALNGNVFRAKNGKVYGAIVSFGNYSSLPEAWGWALQAGKNVQWYELYEGRFTPVAGVPAIELEGIVAGSQMFRNYEFKSGRKLVRFDAVAKVAAATDPATGKTVEYRLDYPSEGAHQMGIVAVSTGVITGATSFPMRNFVYDPATDTMTERDASLQWNSFCAVPGHLFVGAYNGGILIDWKLDEPFERVSFNPKYNKNPRIVGQPARPQVIRPHAVALSADGRFVVMGGTPEYGHTGGGLAVWERSTDTVEVLPNERLIRDQSVYALTALPDGRLFGGTTVEAGTGGVVKAKTAELFEFDPAAREMIWHGEALPGAKTYHQLFTLADGRVLGFADLNRVFLFDPKSRSVLAETRTTEFGDGIWQQGPRMMVRDGDEIYLLCRRAIVRVNPADATLTKVADSPVDIEVGGDILNRRLYFGSHARLCSFQLPASSR